MAWEDAVVVLIGGSFRWPSRARGPRERRQAIRGASGRNARGAGATVPIQRRRRAKPIRSIRAAGVSMVICLSSRRARGAPWRCVRTVERGRGKMRLEPGKDALTGRTRDARRGTEPDAVWGQTTLTITLTLTDSGVLPCHSLAISDRAMQHFHDRDGQARTPGDVSSERIDGSVQLSCLRAHVCPVGVRPDRGRPVRPSPPRPKAAGREGRTASQFGSAKNP